MGLGSSVRGTSPFAIALLLAVLACSDPAPHDSASSPPQAGSGGGASNTSGGNAGSPGVGGSNAGAASTGGSNGSGSGGVGGAATASCNELVLDAPAWGLSYDPDPAPTALGGEFVDGTFFVTKEIVYGASSGPTLPLARSKVTIAGTSWQEVEGDPEPGGVNPDRRRTSSMSVTGSRLSLTRSCPESGMVQTTDFTVEASGFTLYIDDIGKRIGVVFATQ